MAVEGHVVHSVTKGSIADEMGFEPGDAILSINGRKIEDIFDYRFFCNDEYLEISVLARDGHRVVVEVEKEYSEDLGLEFENGLMDEYRSCRNACIFCFVDQMPPGLRKTLYFKDDDARLSFLQGNYITLTNLSEHDISRLIEYKMEPLNISVHTMNPQLRCRMLRNRSAGDDLKKMEAFYKAGLEMNGQIVMCRGLNDRDELDSTIEALVRYIPCMKSVSVVPAGLTKYREGLTRIEPITPDDARDTIRRIEDWQRRIFQKHGIHFVHASDEFYIMAGLPLPEASRYDGYLQLANGVGMIRSLYDDFITLAHTQDVRSVFYNDSQIREDVSVATGTLAYDCIKKLASLFMDIFPSKAITVHPIKNIFFGESITVAGLVTGNDLIDQLKKKELGDRLLIPSTMLRHSGDVFLDDVTIGDVHRALHTPVNIVESSGIALFCAMMGHNETTDGRFVEPQRHMLCGYEPEDIYL